MDIVQYLLFGLVALLVFSSFQSEIFTAVSKLFSKKPESAAIVIQDKIEQLKEAMEKGEGEVEKKNSFSELVLQWEVFTNMLKNNGMKECTEDMKTVLIKMAEEYRKELNEDDGISDLDSIIVKDNGINSLRG
jgi:hypothetical protein